MRNNLRRLAAREWEDWKVWLLGRHVHVPAERVREGHLMLEHEGALIDLGPCTLEDLRLIAFVTQEAYIRLPSKRGRSKTSPMALGRVRNVTRQFWEASLDPDNLRRRVPGREADESVAVSVDGVVTSGEPVIGRAEKRVSLDPVTEQ